MAKQRQLVSDMEIQLTWQQRQDLHSLCHTFLDMRKGEEGWYTPVTSRRTYNRLGELGLAEENGGGYRVTKAGVKYHIERESRTRDIDRLPIDLTALKRKMEEML